MVVSLGNTAISFGQEETSWGVSHYNQLSQSNNGQPFPALRIQNIHPGHLPWFLRYLGLYRYQAFLGQLNAGRTFSKPWLSGHVITFRTLPFFEWGLEHTIMFGGSGNDNYGPGGFLGNLTGLSTGNSSQYNTNTRFGIFGKAYIRRLRDTQIYGEVLSEDFFNAGGISGLKLPFKGPSYTAGLYVPKLTLDGRTTARFEYALTDKEYSVHNDSLYWTYNNALMGSSLGPGAWQVNFEVDRWLNLAVARGHGHFLYSPPGDRAAVLHTADAQHRNRLRPRVRHASSAAGNHPAGKFARRDESARGHGIRHRHQLHQLQLFPRAGAVESFVQPVMGRPRLALGGTRAPVN